MYDYTQAKMNDDAIRAISSIGLAHLGDAVYELLVRTYLCVHGKATGKGLHRATVELVCAPQQARFAVHHADSALVAGVGAQAAAVAFFFVDFDNFANHSVFSLYILFLVLR